MSTRIRTSIFGALCFVPGAAAALTMGPAVLGNGVWIC